MESILSLELTTRVSSICTIKIKQEERLCLKVMISLLSNNPMIMIEDPTIMTHMEVGHIKTTIIKAVAVELGIMITKTMDTVAINEDIQM